MEERSETKGYRIGRLIDGRVQIHFDFGYPMEERLKELHQQCEFDEGNIRELLGDVRSFLLVLPLPGHYRELFNKRPNNKAMSLFVGMMVDKGLTKSHSEGLITQLVWELARADKDPQGVLDSYSPALMDCRGTMIKRLHTRAAKLLNVKDFQE